jgi:ABC-2 type transport system permease protein
MSRSEIIITFIQYEIKRAIARKKVLALVAFTILLGTVPYYALSAAGATIIPNNIYPYIWVVGIFSVGPLFLNFTAILIAAGAMAEEYEQGTAELLLSKPIRRSDYFIGKFLGGYILFLSILALNIFLSVTSAYTFFGMQSNLNIIPGIFLAQAFSSLVFYSLAFMLGELIRRASLAYIFSSAIFFSSFIISTFMGLIYTLTGSEIYKTIQIYLPTSPANSLPIQYALPNLPPSITNFAGFINTTTAVPTIELSIQILLIYTLITIAIAVVYFLRSDISRKLN